MMQKRVELMPTSRSLMHLLQRGHQPVSSSYLIVEHCWVPCTMRYAVQKLLNTWSFLKSTASNMLLFHKISFHYMKIKMKQQNVDFLICMTFFIFNICLGYNLSHTQLISKYVVFLQYNNNIAKLSLSLFIVPSTELHTIYLLKRSDGFFNLPIS